MQLMTKKLEKALPPLNSQDGKGDDAIAYAHYFHPLSSWDWYATEYDMNDRLFFGFVFGNDEEWGYFSLTEMEETRVHGVRMEWDLHFTPRTIREIKEERNRAKAR